MRTFLFTSLAYLVLPLVTLYSCFAAIYLLDVRDPEFLPYLILWLPGIFLYYIYIGQLIIGQRLPFLDRIWGFPNLVRRHRSLFARLLLLTLVLHAGVHLYEDGIEKVLLKPDLGMWAAYVVVVLSIVLMVVAAKRWLAKQPKKAADYAKMHKLHRLFYLLAIAIWYHVITAGAFEDNLLGQILITGYLLFALACKLYMLISERTAPVYELESVETPHRNFVCLQLRAPASSANIGKRHRKRVEALQNHEAGQYAYFSFGLESHNGAKMYWEQHPFSFASYASTLTIVVKNLGNFTAELPNLVTVGTKVRVHGPFGKFCEQSFSEGTHLIATGVGITPFISMLEKRALQAANAAPLTLHWFVKEEQELIFGDRFEYFLKNIPNLKIHSYVGQHLSENTFHEILSCPQSSYRQLGVMYCGPGALAPVLKKVMSRLGIPRANFHTELFSM